MMPVEVRAQLADALRLDLVGPGEVLGAEGRVLGDVREILLQRPSTWYLTGFLVPLDAAPEQKTDEQGTDELDEGGDTQGFDDAVTPDRPAARVRYLPSSIGASLLVAADAKQLKVIIRWGDYKVHQDGEGEAASSVWDRTACEEEVVVVLPDKTEQPHEQPVPNAQGLAVAVSVRPVVNDDTEGGLPTGTRSVSVFLVNRRAPQADERIDQAFAFQAQLEIHGDRPFVPRPNLRSLESDDPDERVADLQYRDAFEFAVGHSVATEAIVNEAQECWFVRTGWIPQAEVEHVAPADIQGVDLSMDSLSQLADATDAQAKLGAFVTQYREWIDRQRRTMPASPARRHEIAEELLNRASVAANRIEQGIALLAEPQVLKAFRIANRAMAAAARRRQQLSVDSSQLSEKKGSTVPSPLTTANRQPTTPSPLSVDSSQLSEKKGSTAPSPLTTDNRQLTTPSPHWRPFQLAFLLMNLPGIVDPHHPDRDVVDLLFFPTGGGKTEAYLGLAAFTLVWRRLQHPGIASAGLSVLMRYTLRLLTLDQLGRAATLICALELERQQDVETLGTWPFEIGLWVGQAATPNTMGARGDNNSHSARARTIAFKNDNRKPSPIPLEDCPWCGTKFTANSFQLQPNPDTPIDLRVICINRRCAFTRDQALPILAVDEPIYRRLPCFMIATVDKFAAMPWTGDVGQFFGRVDRYDRNGFYGPCHTGQGQPLPAGRLLPPDLIIQDELHLISGPLGTMVGLYETALDELCSHQIEGQTVRPKIVASTATVRRAESQIRALFNHHLVDIFPPPGPDRRDSFFAETHRTEKSNARLYLGIAAQGRSPKVVMLRVYLALLAAAQKAYLAHGKRKDPANPTDPYMTLLGYFNSLRELGGARRLIEDEVGNRVTGYGSRKRLSEFNGLFANRKIDYDVVELTSRVSTDKVAEAKRQLSLTFDEKEHVDVAIATNMISVGLDIVRLGLMVVFGQPKTSAEYIQATSRVGRDPERPGLVVTLLNIHKPRDRSHYERFAAYHESFYRSVEATSVTPFSPRALDRGLAGTLVALARLGHAPMTPALGAGQILNERAALDFAVEVLGARAHAHAHLPDQEADALRQRIRERAKDLLDEWSRIAMDQHDVGGQLQYQREAGAAQRLLHEFLNPALKQQPPRFQKFRANRSMRDVEPSVNLWLRTLDDVEIEEDDQP